MGYSFHQAQGNVNNQLQISVRHLSVARWRTIKSVPVISDPIHAFISTLNASPGNAMLNYFGNTIHWITLMEGLPLTFIHSVALFPKKFYTSSPNNK